MSPAKPGRAIASTTVLVEDPMSWKLDRFTCRHCHDVVVGWEFKGEVRFRRHQLRRSCEDCSSAHRMARRHEAETGEAWFEGPPTHSDTIRHDFPRPWLTLPSATSLVYGHEVAELALRNPRVPTLVGGRLLARRAKPCKPRRAKPGRAS